MSKAILTIIGTAQDGGVPHPNCYCENCRDAMNNGNRRFAASLAIILPNQKQWHLIDASPDLKEQMTSLQRAYELEGKLMSSIFLTHAHMGHLPGLLFLGKEGMNTTRVPVYVGKKLKDMLETNAPWKLLKDHNNIALKQLTKDEAVMISDSINIIPFCVPHRNEFSETFGYWIHGPNKKVLYIPDIDRWEEWELDILKVSKLADICLLDGTFYSSKDLEHIKRDLHEVPHPLITTTMDRLQTITSETKIYFTHFNHSNPAISLTGEIRNEIEMRGFHLAEEGMEILI
jgi:pyrroloquinoline quinone biosynthesis protein B